MRSAALGLFLVLALAAPGGVPVEEGWRTFGGSWSASGRVETLPTEGEHPASIVRLSGSVVLTAGEGLSRGFRGEAIGFDDGTNIRIGRSVWTDDRGDRIFFSLRGEPLETGRHVAGTITGGSGRYAGLKGEFDLTWQYVVRSEDGTLQGKTSVLRGRYLPPSKPK
jgi:hypothetical protein